ncbi:hypothetical protein MYX75_00060 [Acidobacteria bacterium AH-259-A15]|nr:hypothetical protein [Acidobacteria bacterium AH-259-A15]
MTRTIERKTTTHKYHPNNIVICLFLALISVLAYLPWINKPYTADESIFLLQTDLLSKGIFPIRDFFSHNTPNFLLVYGAFTTLFGMNIFTARMASYLIGATIGILAYLIVLKAHRNRSVAFLVWLTVQTSLLFLGEASPLSGLGHGLTSSLFMMIALYIILVGHTEDTSHLIRMFVFGFCIAFSIWSRHVTLIVNVGLFVMCLVLLWRLSEIRKAHKFKATLTSLAGITCGSSFVIYLFLSRPDTFIYAYLRATDLMRVMREVGFYQTLRPWSFEKLALGDFLMSFGGQTALLLLFAIYGFFLVALSREYRPYGKASLLSIWVIISFTGSYLIFSKHGFTWHYLGVLAPFFAVAGSPFVFASWKEIDRRKSLGVFLLSTIVLHSAYGIMFYTGKFKTTLADMIYSEGSRAGIANASSRDVRHVRFIAEQISKLIPNGGKLLSCNSAVFVEMNLIPPIPFGYWESLAEWAYATRGDKNLNRHHLITQEQLLGMIKGRYFDVVLLDALFPGVSGGNQRMRQRYKHEVAQNYVLYKQFGESQIYIKPSITPIPVRF